MKRILLACSLAIFSFGVPHQDSLKKIKWITNYDQGIELARETKRPVLVDFWAVWCGPCQRMEEFVYPDSKLIQESERFVCIKVDVDKNRKTARAFKIKVIPTILFIDPWENLITGNEGFLDAEALLVCMKLPPSSFEAGAAAFEAVKKNPEDFEGLLGVGKFYEKTKLLPMAKEFYSRAAKTAKARQDPLAMDSAQIALGLLALKMGAPKEAEKIFKGRCQNCDPKNEGFMLVGLGISFYRQEKIEEAKKTFEQVVAKFPETEACRLAQQNLDKLASQKKEPR
jgi:thiol-disulfide isomerase/thioredoxin